MDLSVSGAGLFGLARSPVRINDLMIVAFNGAKAVVNVRRAQRTNDDNLRYFRVEFVSMQPAFEREVRERVCRARLVHERSGVGLAMTKHPHQASSDEADPEKQATPAGFVKDLENEAEAIGASTDPDPPAPVDDPIHRTVLGE